MSLLTAIQANDPQAQSHLHALMTGARPPAPTVQVHLAPAALTRWATNYGYSKLDSCKNACETGGFSGNTYLFLEEDTGLVMTVTYEPWNLLSMIILKMILRFWCAVLTNTCMTSYRTT
jgi:hypothetical protein